MFTKFIKNSFKNNIYNYICSSIRSEYSSDSASFNSTVNIAFNDLTIVKSAIQSVKNDVIYFNTISYVRFSIVYSSSKENRTNSMLKWYTLICNLDLKETPLNISITSVKEYEKDDSIAYFTDDLVPNLSNSLCEKICKDLLCNYYAITNCFSSFDSFKFANMLHLTVKYQDLSNDSSILGQIILDKHNNHNLEYGTILINQSLKNPQKIGQLNFTIIHECMHWVLHRHIFIFHEAVSCSSPDTFTTKNFNIMTYDNKISILVEEQANKLASRILLPENQVKKMVEILIDKYINSSDLKDYASNYQKIVAKLAKHFSTSYLATKIRLIELGYEWAHGTFNYYDGKYVMPYYTSNEIKNPCLTYTISYEDIINLSKTNPLFSKHLSTQLFVFADNHICINSNKYIYFKNGRLLLNTYARNHIDECCLPFEISKDNNQNLCVYHKNTYYLSRDRDVKIQLDIKYNGKDNSHEINEQISRRIKDVSKQLQQLPNSFSQTLKSNMKWAGMTVEDLEFNSGVSSSTINRLRSSDDFKKEKNTVIKLCVGMNLPYELSQDMLGKAGLKLEGTERDLTINFFLQTLSLYDDITSFNDKLTSLGHKPL